MAIPPGTPIRTIINVEDPSREIGDAISFLGNSPPAGWRWLEEGEEDPLMAFVESPPNPEAPEVPM